MPIKPENLTPELSGAAAGHNKERETMKRHPLDQPWYLLGEPWAHGDYAGTMILAGNPDPHIGLTVCDTCDVLAEETDVETAREVAAHIVKLHNASLTD